MTLGGRALLVGERFERVDDAVEHGALANVVEQPGDSDVGEGRAIELEHVTDRHRHRRDVDRVRVRHLVVVPEARGPTTTGSWP